METWSEISKILRLATFHQMSFLGGQKVEWIHTLEI